jgi:hypothetical protein
MVLTFVRKLYSNVIANHQQDATHNINASFAHICNTVNENVNNGIILYSF